MNSSVIVKVMVVDDEPLALDDICTIFEWESNGFNIVAKARNGAEAFEAYKKTNPDIVITDVRMPVMDGIELVRKIRRLNMNTRIIFLTSFEDFGYAKEALRLSVKDYILKYEISEESVKKILVPVREEIISEQKNYNLKFSRYITEHFDSKFVVTIDEQCDDKLQKIIDCKYYYILLEECMPFPIVKNYTADKWPVPVEPEKVISQCMDFEYCGIKVSCAAILCQCRYLVLIRDIDIASQTALVEILRKFVRNLTDKLNGLLNRGFTAYIVPIKYSFEEARKYHKDNASKIYCRYLFGQNKIYSTLDDKIAISMKPLEIDKNLITNLVKQKKSDEIAKILNNVCEKAIADNNYPGFSVAVGTLINIIKSIISPINTKSLLIGSRDISSMYDARSLTRWIIGKFEEIINLQQYDSHEHTRYVQKAIDYMNTNFKNSDFSIDQMAFDISLSVVRLEKLFKQDTGKTIIDYLTQLRVNSAQELLIHGNLKVYEVSDQVGYSSSQYFSKVFRKAVGMSPLDYKLRGNRQ